MAPKTTTFRLKERPIRLLLPNFNMETREKEVKKQTEVLGGNFDPANYEEKRVWATAADGTKIPVSMIYRKGMKKDGSNPLLQYGYGS